MTSHDSRLSHHAQPQSRGKTTTSSESKSKEDGSLHSLREIYKDIPDDVLRCALEDAHGNPDLAADRLSTGDVNQWKVISKKPKKASQPESTAQPAQSSTQQPRPPRRTEKAPVTPKSYGNNKSASAKPARRDIGKTPKPNEVRGAKLNDTWGAPASVGDTRGGSDTWGSSSSVQKTVASTSTDTSSSEKKPTSWASLLKQNTKPEEKSKVSKNEPVEDFKDEKKLDSWNEPDGNALNDPWNQPSGTVTSDSWDKPHDDVVTEGDGRSSTDHKEQLQQQQQQQQQHQTQQQSQQNQTTLAPVVEDSGWAAEKPNEESGSNNAIEKKPAVVVVPKTERRLNQEEPVVLPNTNTTMSSVGVNFGSLSLDDQEPERQPVHQHNYQQQQPSVQPAQPATQHPVAQKQSQQALSQQTSQVQQPQVPQQQQMYYNPIHHYMTPYSQMYNLYSPPTVSDQSKLDPAQPSHNYYNPNPYMYAMYGSPYMNGYNGQEQHPRSAQLYQSNETVDQSMPAGQDFFMPYGIPPQSNPYVQQSQAPASSGLPNERIQSPQIGNPQNYALPQQYGYPQPTSQHHQFQANHTGRYFQSPHHHHPQPPQQQQQQNSQPNQNRPY